MMWVVKQTLVSLYSMGEASPLLVGPVQCCDPASHIPEHREASSSSVAMLFFQVWPDNCSAPKKRMGAL